MTAAATTALLAGLRADSTLEDLLGGAGRIRLGSLPNPARMPEITIAGGTGLSTPGFGYRVHGHRDAETNTAVDCWATIPETAQACMERAVVLVCQGIPGLDPAAWLQTTDAAQDPVQKELWHAVLRFPARHHVSDI